MPSFTITIDGKKYKTEAPSKKEAEKKIKDHLDKNGKTSKSSSKTKSSSNKSSEAVSVNSKIIDYNIITNESQHTLSDNIKGYIKDGWQPIGGVSVVDYQGKGLIGGTSRYTFAQAIVKYSRRK